MPSSTVSRPSSPSRLAQGLDALAQRYVSPAALELDPIRVPLSYEKASDQEFAAWVAATLAYGRVAPMLRAIEAALAPLGPTPTAWLETRSEASIQQELKKALKGWVWRFHTAEDVIHWMLAWKRWHASGGVESHFLPRKGESSDAAFSRAIQTLRAHLPRTSGLRFSLTDPLEGGACKRWRLFMRWMVRQAWPDLGLWTRYPAHELIIPLDTHVARVARFVGLSKRATADGAMAREVTEALKRMDASDPLRFDFALSHLGIMGDCPGTRRLPGCRPCPLHPVCKAGKR